jgi:hypothetical protein
MTLHDTGHPVLWSVHELQTLNRLKYVHALLLGGLLHLI